MRDLKKRYLFLCFGTFGHSAKFLILPLAYCKQMTASRHPVHLFMFQLPQTSFDLLQGSRTRRRGHRRRAGMYVRIVQRRRCKVTEMVILHHLFRRRHLVMRGRVGVHGDRVVSRQAVDMMARSSIHTTVGHRVRDWRSGCHAEGQTG